MWTIVKPGRSSTNVAAFVDFLMTPILNHISCSQTSFSSWVSHCCCIVSTGHAAELRLSEPVNKDDHPEGS